MAESVPSRLAEALSNRYRIVRELGEGGMATVYLAEDLKHDRRVALKVLKPELAAVIGAERFVAEIKTTAALQHPHILPLFDSGEADSFLFYVMPYVEGETLREKIRREKQLGVPEAIELARNVADALDYAHRQGVIHRDIKPANILLADGRPVVADFGIAVAVSAASGQRLTETGLSLGTPHYMSPEQATADRDLTARSDVYSLACVLYEMLTGDPPHTASTAQAVLVKILTEPAGPVTAARSSVPPHVSAALQKALEKLPADRFASAADFRNALDDPHFTHSTALAGAAGAGSPPATQSSWLSDIRAKLALGAIAVAAIGGYFLGQGSAPAAEGPLGDVVHRYFVGAGPRGNLTFDISSRGDVAYSTEWTGIGEEMQLAVRRSQDTVAVVLPGTGGGTWPRFSPEGDWIAFSTVSRAIKKVQPSTGTVVTLVPEGELGQPLVEDWTNHGSIIFRAGPRIFSVPAEGGQPEVLVETAAPLGSSELLPDGRTLLYTDGNFESSADLLVLDLKSGSVDTIVRGGGAAQWSPTGHIVYGTESGTLFAVPFDLRRRMVTGPGVPVREGVYSFGAFSLFRLSSTGSLAYMPGLPNSVDATEREIAWLDLDGSIEPIPMAPIAHSDVSLSPNARQIAYHRDDEIFLFDLDLGTDQRLTFEGEGHHDPVWSPDGSRIAYSSESGGVWIQDVDGRSAPEPVVMDSAGQAWVPWAWLDDGTVVLTLGLWEDADVYMVRAAERGATPTPLLQDPWQESQPAVSPDGALMAYISTESGLPHLFVREFPSMTGRWQVSDLPVTNDPLSGPHWAPDGDAIYYLDSNGVLVRAELSRTPSLRVTRRSQPFPETIATTVESVHPYGNRFLVSYIPGLADVVRQTPDILVAVNWIAELRERVGAGN